MKWLTFTVFGYPDLNGVDHTFTITAGVVWSLTYEWFFYLLLPLLALAIRPRERPSAVWLVFGLAAASVIGWRLPSWEPLVPFAMGMAAAWLVRWKPFVALARGQVAPWLVLTCAAAASTGGTGMQSRLTSVLALGLAFWLVAAGCSVFGALISKTSRTLGEWAYSIYLLQGFFLFTLFHFALGPEAAASLSPAAHWGLVVVSTPFFIALCWASFRWIELPGMSLAGHLSRRFARRNAGVELSSAAP